MKKMIRIGTRGSLLALTQAGQVLKELRRKNPKITFRLQVIRTTGDEYQSVELFRKNNTGVFTKEIERELLAGRIDIAVHSLKDLPTELPRGLALAAFPKRLDTRDVLISRQKYTLKTLPPGAVVATGSPRRKRQLEILRPDLKLVDLRGNLDTRVGRVLQKKDFHAVVLARAGLERINRYLRYAVALPADKILPAVGQAALGLEVRSPDRVTARIVSGIDHAPTRARVSAERAFLKTLHGGCRVPVGVDSRISGERLKIKAFVFSTKNDRWIAETLSGPATQAEAIGVKLAKKLLSRGAARLLNEAREGGLR